MSLSSRDSQNWTREAQTPCTVIVASFRPGSLIHRCVRSLLAQEGAPPEIIIVDSSGDGTAAQLRAAFPTITVIDLPRQTPQAVARKIGVKHARTQFIAITDQDCEVPSDWLQRLLSRHGQGHYDAVGGAITNGTPESAVGTASYLIEFNEFLPEGRPRLTEMIPHCNICFRREAFDTYGPFIEAPPGAEDLLYNFSLCQKGGRLFFDPTISVTHLNRTDFRSFLQHQWVLGFGSAVARRAAPLPGQIFVRYPFLSYGLPLVRLFRTMSRLLFSHRPIFWRYLRLLPLLLPGYMRWSSGFRSGARTSSSLPRLNLSQPVAQSFTKPESAPREIHAR